MRLYVKRRRRVRKGASMRKGMWAVREIKRERERYVSRWSCNFQAVTATSRATRLSGIRSRKCNSSDSVNAASVHPSFPSLVSKNGDKRAGEGGRSSLSRASYYSFSVKGDFLKNKFHQVFTIAILVASTKGSTNDPLAKSVCLAPGHANYGRDLRFITRDGESEAGKR